MYKAVKEKGLIPFFENVIPGYSVEELTPREFWFDGEEDGLGPWDWKIECVQSGDIVYGKFLLGGKAAFATLKWYRELMLWRRSKEKYRPDEAGHAILDYLKEKGTITIREVRHLLGVKKSAADAAITRLMMQCRVVTGDIIRVYRGADLHYNGWQVSSFCTPEDLYDELSGLPQLSDAPGLSGFHGLSGSHSPSDALEALIGHIRDLTGENDRSQIMKIIR